MCVSSAPERDGERGGEGAERERESSRSRANVS